MSIGNRKKVLQKSYRILIERFCRIFNGISYGMPFFSSDFTKEIEETYTKSLFFPHVSHRLLNKRARKGALEPDACAAHWFVFLTWLGKIGFGKITINKRSLQPGLPRCPLTRHLAGAGVSPFSTLTRLWLCSPCRRRRRRRRSPWQ